MSKENVSQIQNQLFIKNNAPTEIKIDIASTLKNYASLHEKIIHPLKEKINQTAKQRKNAVIGGIQTVAGPLGCITAVSKYVMSISGIIGPAIAPTVIVSAVVFPLIIAATSVLIFGVLTCFGVWRLKNTYDNHKKNIEREKAMQESKKMNQPRQWVPYLVFPKKNILQNKLTNPTQLVVHRSNYRTINKTTSASNCLFFNLHKKNIHQIKTKEPVKTTGGRHFEFRH